MLNAIAIASMLRSATFLFPRSIPLMYVRSKPQRDANSSCDTSACFRSCRTRFPNLTVIFVRRATCTGTARLLRIMRPRTMSHTEPFEVLANGDRIV